jgi:hypothetical protein
MLGPDPQEEDPRSRDPDAKPSICVWSPTGAVGLGVKGLGRGAQEAAQRGGYDRPKPTQERDGWSGDPEGKIGAVREGGREWQAQVYSGPTRERTEKTPHQSWGGVQPGGDTPHHRVRPKH